MDSFKKAINALNEQKALLKKKTVAGTSYMRYGDVIKEKIAEAESNIKEESNHISIGSLKEPMKKENEEKEEFPQSEEKTAENILKAKAPREFKTIIDTGSLIEIIKEQEGSKKTINTDKFTAEEKCIELYNWFHLMFIEWEKELSEIKNEEKESSEGRLKLGIYQQCRGYIKPLLHLLKKNEITKEIMNKLFEVMVYCREKDFIKAHEKYIELAIGNAPWPMGVTMVGIHERTGRSKIYKSQVAHILNDESTKKYLQSVKRIISLSQRLSGAGPTESVNS